MAKFMDLEDLVAAMPGHVYWLDRNNVYQGCNDLQAKALQLPSKRDIFGKRNRDFTVFDSEIVAILDKNNLDVMESKVAKVFEEPAILEDGRRITHIPATPHVIP